MKKANKETVTQLKRMNTRVTVAQLYVEKLEKDFTTTHNLLLQVYHSLDGEVREQPEIKNLCETIDAHIREMANRYALIELEKVEDGLL